MELMCWMNCRLCSACWMTEVSSTYLSHRLGGFGAGLMALDSKSSLNRVNSEGFDGAIHGYTMDLFKILTLEEEVGIFEGRLQQCNGVSEGQRGPVVK